MLKHAMAAALVLGAWSGALIAQDQVSPEVFLDQAVGNTLTFRSFQSGNLVGDEQFLRRDLSVWADAEGRCTYGTIEIRGPQLCFLYDDMPDPDNCWLIFIHDGEFLVMSDLEVQRISRIDEYDLSCEDAPVS